MSNKYDFFTTKKEYYEITGKHIKKIPQKPSQEIKKFHHISRKQNFPNSNRVIIHDENNNDINTNNQKISHRNIFNKKSLSQAKQNKQYTHHPQEENNFAFISNVDYKIKTKPPTNNNIESFDFKNERTNIAIPIPKRSNRITPFTNHSTTTQIVNLPGGIKRIQPEQNDESRNKLQNANKYNSYSNKAKIINEYNTNIQCLPGCPFNEKPIYKEDIPKRRMFSNKSRSDIFNLNTIDQERTRQISANKGGRKVFPEQQKYGKEYNTINCNIEPFGGIRRTVYKNKSNVQLI